MTTETRIPKPVRKSPIAKAGPAPSEAVVKARFERLLRNLTQAKWPLSPELMRRN